MSSQQNSVIHLLRLAQKASSLLGTPLAAAYTYGTSNFTSTQNFLSAQRPWLLLLWPLLT
jgi:hypothetical protein